MENQNSDTSLTSVSIVSEDSGNISTSEKSARIGRKVQNEKTAKYPSRIAKIMQQNFFRDHFLESIWDEDRILNRHSAVPK